MYCVYILRDPDSGRLYYGSTSDLNRRLAEHHRRKPSYKLIYKEIRQTKDEAFRREMFLKSGNGRRALRNLIKGDNLENL